MKTWMVALIMLVVGAAAGWVSAQVFWLRAFRAAIPTAIQSIEEKQEYSCVLSLAALSRLEADDIDRAKSLLAREVASYYRHPFTQANSPARKKLMTQIETVRSKSSALNEELTKKPE